MALTITQAGSNTSTSSSSSLVISSITAAIGDMLVVVLAADNAGTSGAASVATTACSDSAGNTWTNRVRATRTDGSASADGTTLAVWTAPITSALSSGSITIAFSPSTTSKAAVVYLADSAAGGTAVFSAASAGGSTGNATSATITTSANVTSGYTVIGALAQETNSAITADSDTSNGNWSTAYSALADGGSNSSSQTVLAQYKNVSATANQTFNTSTASGYSYAISYIVLYEDTTNISATPSGVSATVSPGAVNTISDTPPTLTITQAGSNTSTSSSSSLVISSVTAAVGDMLVVVCAADNNGTSGVASVAANACSDSSNNTWTNRVRTTRTDGSVAADGTTLVVWTAPITTALSAGSITIAFSPNTTAKSAVVYRAVGSGLSGAVSFSAASSGGSTGNATGPTITTAANVSSSYTIIGALSAETNSAITADSDTSNGSWSTAYSALADGGGNSSSQTVLAQYKNVSATAAQTFNVTLASAYSYAISYVVIYEDTANVSATPSGKSATASLGSASVTTIAAVTAAVTGVGATVAAGAAATSLSVSATVTGKAATASTETVTPTYDFRCDTVFGESAITLLLGNVATPISSTTPVYGVDATSAIQSATTRYDFAATVSGVSARTGVGRYNLALNSEALEQWSSTSWLITFETNTADTTDPLGGNTAEKITPSTKYIQQHWLRYPTSFLPKSNYTATASIYGKKGTTDYFALMVSGKDATNGACAWANFNLNNGTIVRAQGEYGGTYVGSSITDVGNGWYRMSVTGSFSPDVSSAKLSIWGDPSTADVVSWAGTSTPMVLGSAFGLSVYLWGAQLELGSVMNPYAPTGATEYAVQPLETRSSANVATDGVEATSAIQSAATTYDFAASATGVSATAATGAVAVSVSVYAEVTGTSATSSVGTVTAIPAVSATPESVSASAQLGYAANYAPYSEDFSWASYWVVASDTTETTDPIGGNTAEKMSERTNSGYHDIGYAMRSWMPHKDEPATASIYVKSGGSLQYFQLLISEWYTAYWLKAAATFDILGGTLVGYSTSDANITVTDATITDAGNGWWRLSLSVRPNVASYRNSLAMSYGPLNSNSTAINAGYYGGSDRVYYLWGAQLERSSSVGAYSKTTAENIWTTPVVAATSVSVDVTGVSATVSKGSVTANYGCSVTVYGVTGYARAGEPKHNLYQYSEHRVGGYSNNFDTVVEDTTFNGERCFSFTHNGGGTNKAGYSTGTYTTTSAGFFKGLYYVGNAWIALSRALTGSEYVEARLTGNTSFLNPYTHTITAANSSSYVSTWVNGATGTGTPPYDAWQSLLIVAKNITTPLTIYATHIQIAEGTTLPSYVATNGAISADPPIAVQIDCNGNITSNIITADSGTATTTYDFAVNTVFGESAITTLLGQVATPISSTAPVYGLEVTAAALSTATAAVKNATMNMFFFFN